MSTRGGGCLQENIVCQATVTNADETVKETYVGFASNFKNRYRNHKVSHKNLHISANLCLHKKFIIICRPEICLLNKRNELVSACRHKTNTCCVIHHHIMFITSLFTSLRDCQIQITPMFYLKREERLACSF